ncbi:unnamed protein product [Symbiodinium sp. CCMP2592]|nr:unnamed protein product [Symbiodinium sp. CCMP2592]
MEQSPQAHAGVPSSVHPASIVEEHGKVWLQHWKPESPVNFDAVQRILDRVPGGPQSDIVLQVEAEALMRATKAMRGKAMGPDRWSAELLLRLPVPWWEAAATLWNAVLSTKYVPRLWRRALIALVPKRLDEYRPIALCPVIWRAGAHCISRNVLPWMDTWLGHHTLGGAPCRGPGDAHARLFHAWQSGGKVFCQQDLTRFFDSLDVQAVGMVLRHLGAPAGLAELLASFYQDASRLFLHEGRSSSAWGSPARGLAQGCPLSPMAAVAVGHIWAMWVQSFAKGRTDCLIFIDDRVLWPSCTCADPLGAMDVALRASDSFDQAFGFQCRASKCAVVCPPDVGTFDQWASARSYPRVTTLKVLGITLDMQEGALGLLKFSPRLLLHRLRFLKLLGGEVPQLRRIVLQLVHSAMFWAGGVACPDRDCLRDVWHSTCAVLQKHATFESPKVLLCASFGWSLDPEWAADWASLRAAWRFKARPPAWLDTAGLDVACGDWRRFLPGAAMAPSWHGSTIRAPSGWESFDVVKRWLVDHYKWQGVHSCGRIRNRGHRDDATLARGLSLGAPLRSARFALEGHRLAVAAEPTREVRLAALGSGGSIWYHCKRLEMSSPDTTACVCGLLQPSRAHLTWCCASTTGLRQGLAPPSTRAGERLFAAEISEYPAAPAASDFENTLQSIVAHLRNFATVGERLLIATDGSAKFDVGGCAVIFGSGDGTFVFGDACEDQSAFRCELLTLTTLFEAISRAQLAPGCQVGILVDCSSALQAVAQPEACSMPLLAHKAARLLRDVSAGGLDLKLSWTPAHGRRPNWTAPWGQTAARCRDLNERADAAANSIREHRARGSGRVSWHAELHHAALWERGAILASAGASNVLAQHLRARRPARHRLAVAAEPTREVRLAALGSGGSIWYHCKRLEMSSPDTTACVCGLLQPSRAHLTWCCASTTGLRQGLAPPSTRAGERLFAAEISEYPAAPAASDFENTLQSIVAHLRNFATVGERLLIATDGSAKFDVGGCAVIFGSGDGTFVFGDACEDQSAFRCELLTLTTLFEAISRAQLAPGCQVGILVDCSSALQAVAQPEACSMPLLAHKAARLLRDVRAGGLDLKLSWTPAHGRRPNWTAPWGLTADRCRDLNDRADAAANSIREHRARGSGRVSWHAELHRAALWERGAILASAGASNVLAQHLRARRPARIIQDDP